MFTFFQVLFAGYLILASALFLASACAVIFPGGPFFTGGIVKNFATFLQESEVSYLETRHGWQASEYAVTAVVGVLAALYFLSAYLETMGFFVGLIASTAVLYAVVRFDVYRNELDLESFGGTDS